MALHLRLENETSLPDGGPVSITVSRQRGIDIGRDQYLDWVLPDPTRFISGKHCEVRYRDGQYWLTDVSTNGTFMNGSEFRVDGTQPLKNGDRIEIGKYIVSVMIEPDASHDLAGKVADDGPVGMAALWDIQQPAAPPINPQALRQPSISSGLSMRDPLDWVADIPSARPLAPEPAPLREWSPAMPVERTPHDAAMSTAPPLLPTMPAALPMMPPAVAPASSDWAGRTIPEPNAPTDQRQTLRPATLTAQQPAMAMPMTDDMVARQPVRQEPPPAGPQPAPAAAASLAAPSFALSSQSVPEPQMPQAAAFAGMDIRRQPGPDSQPLAPPPLPPLFHPATDPPAMRNLAASPATAAAPGATGTNPAFKAAFARGAGVPESVITSQSDEAFAEMLGAFVRLTADNLRQLHMARAQSKGAMRSSNMTMIQAVDNNPLRFSPTTEDALRILFGPPTASYLSPQKALESSFHDLKKHQMAVFGAMQVALAKLIEDLEPAKIDAAVEQDKGVSSLLRSRQARLWQHYETAWKARAGKSDHGMLDVFMRLFSEAYDKNS